MTLNRLHFQIDFFFRHFNPLPHREAFQYFANRLDPDQAALARNMIRYDPTLVDLGVQWLSGRVLDSRPSLTGITVLCP